MKTNCIYTKLGQCCIRIAGQPLLNLRKGILSGCNVLSIRGILNGASNLILSEMEKGVSYSELISKKNNDDAVDKKGTLTKISILANSIMDTDIQLDEIEFKGISNLSKEQFLQAKEKHARWRLVTTIQKKDGKISAHVEPEMIDIANPLAAVNGDSETITFSTDLLGNVTFIGTSKINQN